MMSRQDENRKQLSHIVDHALSPGELRRKADAAWRSYKKQYSQYAPELTWEDPVTAAVSFTVLGLRLSGGIKIESRRLRFTLKVPLPFLLFRKKAIKVIETEMKKWIEF